MVSPFAAMQRKRDPNIPLYKDPGYADIGTNTTGNPLGKIQAFTASDAGKKVIQDANDKYYGTSSNDSEGTFTEGEKRGYGEETRNIPITSQKDEGAVLMREPGTGSAGSSTGMFSSNNPLGLTIDEDNRYLRNGGGAVLLR